MEITIKSDSLYLKSIDNSISFKKQGKVSDSNESKSKPETIRAKQTHERINANPEVFEDKLPQPFRFINTFLHNQVLKEVYSKVFEIEKNKNDPNYEGTLLDITPHGVFECPGISFISNQRDPYEKVWIGNKDGSIQLFDPFHKEKIMSYVVAEGKRVIDIAISVTAVMEFNICSVAVINRNHNEVTILRYKVGENSVYKAISIVRDPSESSNLPWKCKFSEDSRFLSITTYSGECEIYELPSISKVILENPPSGRMEENPISSSNSLKYTLTLAEEVKEILKPSIKLNCRCPIKIPNEEEILEQIFSHSIDHMVAKEEAPEDLKGKPVKGGKAPPTEPEPVVNKDETEYQGR